MDNYDGLIFFAVGLKRLSIIICAEQNSLEEPVACEKPSNPEKRSTFRAWMLSGKCGRQLRYPFFEERFVGFLEPTNLLPKGPPHPSLHATNPRYANHSLQSFLLYYGARYSIYWRDYLELKRAFTTIGKISSSSMVKNISSSPF